MKPLIENIYYKSRFLFFNIVSAIRIDLYDYLSTNYRENNYGVYQGILTSVFSYYYGFFESGTMHPVESMEPTRVGGNRKIFYNT